MKMWILNKFVSLFDKEDDGFVAFRRPFVLINLADDLEIHQVEPAQVPQVYKKFIKEQLIFTVVGDYTKRWRKDKSGKFVSYVIPNYTDIYSIFYNIDKTIVLKKETIEGMNFTFVSRSITLHKPERKVETLDGVIEYSSLMYVPYYPVIYLGEPKDIIYLGPSVTEEETAFQSCLSLIPYIYEPLENTPASEWLMFGPEEKSLVLHDLELVNNLNDLFNDLVKAKETLESINVERGYVKSTNIFDEKEYPIVHLWAKKFLTEEHWNTLDDLNKAKVYRWIAQVIFIDMVSQSTKAMEEISAIKNADTVYIKSRFFSFYDYAYSMLDNSIKNCLLNRRVKIKSNVYAGFDTEYLPLDFGINKLLSGQLSISGGLKIVVPAKKLFTFEGVHTLTNESYFKQPPKFLDTSLVSKWINERIIGIRSITCKNDYILDEIILKLQSYVKTEGFCFSNNEWLFQLKKLPIVNKFIIPENGEELRLSLKTLVYLISKSISLEKDLEDVLKYISGRLNNYAKWSDVDAKNVLPWNGNSNLNDKLETIILSNKENEVKRRIPKLKKSYSLDNVMKVTFDESIYLLGHYNAADLTMLSDWNEMKIKNIDILKKGYISLTKPMEILDRRIFIRDTVLLASAAAGTLEAIGKSHFIDKVEIPKELKGKMDILFTEDFNLFKKYAMRDSLITLIHGLFMNDFSFNLGSKSLPVTLGSLAAKYLGNRWKKDGYKGYQIDMNYLLGDMENAVTPKGIISLGKVGENLNLFVGAFRGGRNECFSYGLDKNETWTDYDLTSCYSTIMSKLGDPMYESEDFFKDMDNISTDVMPFVGDPDYSRSENINPKKEYDYKNGYSALRVKFKFPKEVKYPAIPVALDKDITVYPSEGESLITGLEYLAAKKIIEMYEKQRIAEVEKVLQGVKSIEEQIGQVEAELKDFVSLKIASLLKIQNSLNGKAKEKEFKTQEFKNRSYLSTRKINNINIIKYDPLFSKYQNVIKTINSYSPIKRSINTLNFKNFKKSSSSYIQIISGFYIPFKKDGYNPFFKVINELQANRRSHVKKSAMERIYKDLGNMLYGKTVCGISNKRSFDSRHEMMSSLKGGQLANPIIGGWITGFVRSLIAELINSTHILKGKICAVTTDGFVTNIPNLENKILNLFEDLNYNNSFLQDYRDMRFELSKNPEALEIKTSVKGLIQWTTRGQISIDNSKIKIAAMTGYQKYHFSHQENINIITNSLENDNKIFYLQKRLTGALDSYKKGKQVSMVSHISCFKTIFDTKRKIIHTDDKLMKYSNPYKKVNESLLERTLLKCFSQSVYSDSLTMKSSFVSSLSVIDETLKYFIRDYINYYNNDFDHKEILSIIEDSKVFLNDLPYWNKIKRYFLNNDLIYKMINSIVLRKGVIQNGLSEYAYNKPVIEAIIKTLSNKSYSISFINFVKRRLNYQNKPTFSPPVLPSPSPPPSPVASPPVEPVVDLPVQPNPIPNLLIPWPETIPTEELVFEEDIKKSKKQKKPKISRSRVASSPKTTTTSISLPVPVPAPFGTPLGPVAPPKKKTSKKWEDKFGHRGTPKDP